MKAPPPAKPASLRRFIRSFGHAVRGVWLLVRTQTNARIHLIATAVVAELGFLSGLSREEWCAIVAAIGIVWIAEGLNTAIEAVVDLVSPEYDELAGRAKDLAAGAVLVAAVVAVIIGTLVFWPHVAELV